ncbi:hypothetical protein PVAP13_1KG167915 [Panicum virgatum]|uniref:Uncharacterized protein n=1 Tax=Panicum virgatum TaxID=38727 RepID=A0A8T0X897_PANVG|nr:hypothetical protein PVAP13_1KG167915 [Panicum virgatum]
MSDTPDLLPLQRSSLHRICYNVDDGRGPDLLQHRRRPAHRIFYPIHEARRTGSATTSTMGGALDSLPVGHHLLTGSVTASPDLLQVRIVDLLDITGFSSV